MSIRSYNSRELLKLLIDDDWEIVRVKGSHHQLRHPVKNGLVTIPHPKKRFASTYYREHS